MKKVIIGIIAALAAALAIAVAIHAGKPRSYTIIGGADGPTSIFLAGKLSGDSPQDMQESQDIPEKQEIQESQDTQEIQDTNETQETQNMEDNSAEDASEATLNRSPANLWEYEGYVDECDGYTWQEDFFNCDYDGDGVNDRVNRSWYGKKESATYKIEFGNGDTIITPEGPETGFPHIQSGDLDGDGEKEILVHLTYDTSTDPFSFGDFWLFDKDPSSGEYAEVELPLVKGQYGAKGFNVDFEKLEDNKIRFTLREAGLSRIEEVDEEYIANWWMDDRTTQLRVVFYAEIINEDNPVLRCYVEPLVRWGPMLGFNLNYVNGHYETGYIELDAPDNWG